MKNQDYKVGDTVKIRNVIPNERIWAIITKITGNKVEAKLDNHPMDKRYKYKQIVKFKKSNIEHKWKDNFV